jgi:hypothetical protein
MTCSDKVNARFVSVLMLWNGVGCIFGSNFERPGGVLVLTDIELMNFCDVCSAVDFVTAEFVLAINRHQSKWYCVHCAGLLDVQNISSADTGISQQTEGHPFLDHLISETVIFTPSNVIEASNVLCSVFFYDLCDSMSNQPALWSPDIKKPYRGFKNVAYCAHTLVRHLSTKHESHAPGW